LQRRTTDLEKAIKELRDTQQQVIQPEGMRALSTMASGFALPIGMCEMRKRKTDWRIAFNCGSDCF
jgi:hypothetical protein